MALEFGNGGSSKLLGERKHEQHCLGTGRVERDSRRGRLRNVENAERKTDITSLQYDFCGI